MALSDCSECWETPCSCEHEYKNWSIRKLTEFIETLQNVLGEKLKNEKNIEHLPHLLSPLPHYKPFIDRWNEMTPDEKEEAQKDLIRSLYGK